MQTTDHAFEALISVMWVIYFASWLGLYLRREDMTWHKNAFFGCVVVSLVIILLKGVMHNSYPQ